jgi:hypothetical protein
VCRYRCRNHDPQVIRDKQVCQEPCIAHAQRMHGSRTHLLGMMKDTWNTLPARQRRKAGAAWLSAPCQAVRHGSKMPQSAGDSPTDVQMVQMVL